MVVFIKRFSIRLISVLLQATLIAEEQRFLSEEWLCGCAYQRRSKIEGGLCCNGINGPRQCNQEDFIVFLIGSHYPRSNSTQTCTSEAALHSDFARTSAKHTVTGIIPILISTPLRLLEICNAAARTNSRHCPCDRQVSRTESLGSIFCVKNLKVAIIDEKMEGESGRSLLHLKLQSRTKD